MNDKNKVGTYTIIGSISILLLLIVLLIVKRKAIKQNLMYKIKGQFFTIDELIASNTAKYKGIDNTPSEEVKENLYMLIKDVLDPTRLKYGSYIKVNSGYRSSELNKALGGAASSQHLTGQAADITGGSVDKNKEIFKIIANSGNFDQLIWEKDGTWVHVSYKANGNRKQILNFTGAKYIDITNNYLDIIK